LWHLAGARGVLFEGAELCAIVVDLMELGGLHFDYRPVRPYLTVEAKRGRVQKMQTAGAIFATRPWSGCNYCGILQADTTSNAPFSRCGGCQVRP
jgi:hypothetical protein